MFSAVRRFDMVSGMMAPLAFAGVRPRSGSVPVKPDLQNLQKPDRVHFGQSPSSGGSFATCWQTAMKAGFVATPEGKLEATPKTIVQTYLQAAYNRDFLETDASDAVTLVHPGTFRRACDRLADELQTTALSPREKAEAEQALAGIIQRTQPYVDQLDTYQAEFNRTLTRLKAEIPAWRNRMEQGKAGAVVLDLDGTVLREKQACITPWMLLSLSTSMELSAKAAEAYTESRDLRIPGVIDFIQSLENNGIPYLFATSRGAMHRGATMDQLAGIPGSHCLGLAFIPIKQFWFESVASNDFHLRSGSRADAEIQETFYEGLENVDETANDLWSCLPAQGTQAKALVASGKPVAVLAAVGNSVADGTGNPDLDFKLPSRAPDRILAN
jgi:hypothetical protein